MSTSPFHGYEQRECGEHSTTGARAWCIDCHQWCSPETPCPRCELPRLRAELAAGSGKLDRALAAAQELQDQLRAAVNALPEALHRQVMADREPLDLDDAVLDLAEQRNEARLALDLMTAERDGYRDQLSADWQAKQISDLMAAAGQARSERDEARAELERVRADTLTEAINAVTEQQMKDAATTSALEQDDMACSSFCGHGRTCHTAEAHAAHNRALAALRRALGRSGT